MNTKPKKIYVRVWIALLALLALTWGLAEVNLGPLNNVAALGIAGIKMLLVVWFFMHMRHEPKLTWVFAAAGLIWFLIMVDLTMSDYLTRGDVPGKQNSWRHSEKPISSAEAAANTEHK
jgi:cytochrome c oxidase subunit 4